MKGVAQLMGEGRHPVVGAVKVGKHAALPEKRKGGVEGAAHLAGMGHRVDPTLAEGIPHETAHPWREGGNLSDDKFLRLPIGITGTPFPYRGEQVVECQFLQSERLGLDGKVAAEDRKALLQGIDQRMEGGRIKPGLADRALQRALPSPSSIQGDCGTLDAVEGRGESRRMLLPQGGFPFKGDSAQLSVRTECIAAQLGTGPFSVTPSDLRLGTDRVLEPAESFGAGTTQIAGKVFQFRTHRMSGLFEHLAEDERIGLQLSPFSGQSGYLVLPFLDEEQHMDFQVSNGKGGLLGLTDPLGKKGAPGVCALHAACKSLEGLVDIQDFLVAVQRFHEILAGVLQVGLQVPGELHFPFQILLKARRIDIPVQALHLPMFHYSSSNPYS